MASIGRLGLALVVMASATCGTARADVFLDITSLTTGTSGSFTGNLNGVGVTGAISNNGGGFEFTPTGTGYGDSTIDNSSPQFSYSNAYAVTSPAADRVGYASLFTSATITISFATAVVNPIFHVANLDGSTDVFSLTGGLTGLFLLSGNGGADGDGLGVSGTTVKDTNPSTFVAFPPTSAPPTTGARSAYGSIQLLGSITTLTFTSNFLSGDGGSFTLSVSPQAAVPEPASLSLLGLGLVGIGSAVRLRRRGSVASR